MTVEVSKLTAYGVIGASAGVTVSKVVGYIVMYPGTEAGATPPKSTSYTYGQILDEPNPAGAT